MQRVLAAAVAIGLAATAAQAQQVRYLMPAAFQAAQGESVTLQLRAPGEGALEWPDTGYVFVRAEGTQENRDRLEPTDGAIRWTMQHVGLQMIGMDAAAREETVDGESFGRFLAANAPDVGVAEGPQTVRRVESFKTFVRVGEIRGASETATDKTALKADIRTIMDPTAIRAGSTLAFRAYVEGRSVSGARVKATHLATGLEVWDIADGSGIGRVDLPEPGAWRLEFHDVRPATDTAPVTIHSAVLTFDVREARP